MRTLLNARTAAAAAAALILTGCGGGASRAVLPAAHGAGIATSSPAARARVGLGIHLGGTTTSAAHRVPRYVSTATQIVSATVGGGTPANFNVSSTSPLCAGDGAGGRTCTMMLNATAGPAPQTITVGAYKTAPSNPTETTEPNPPPVSDLLSTGTASVTVVAGAQNAVNVALAGVPASITIEHISSGLGNEQRPVAVKAFDAAGAQIITSRDAGNNEIPYETPITIAVTESEASHFTAGKTTLTKPSDVLNVLYEGFGPDGYHATLTATAGTASASTTFAPFQLHTTSQNVHIVQQPVPFDGLLEYTTFTLSADEFGASSPVDVDLSDCTGTNLKPRATLAGTPAFVAGVLSATVYVTGAGSATCMIVLTDADRTRRAFSLFATGPDNGPLTTAPDTVAISNDGTRGPASQLAAISGGVPPYTVDATPCAGVAAVGFDDVKRLSFATDQFSDNCGVAVHDNGGNTTFVTVRARVYGVPLFVTPGSISGLRGSFPEFKITGGKPPYNLDLGTCSVGIAISHGTLSPGGGPIDDYGDSLFLQNDGTCTMFVTDANSTKVSLPVSVFG